MCPCNCLLHISLFSLHNFPWEFWEDVDWIYRVVPLKHSQFSPKSSQKTPHSLPVRVRYLMQNHIILDCVITALECGSMMCWFSKINSLWPCDAIRWNRLWSALAQVMACCLMARSHYLNQCWVIISEVLWHSIEGNSIRNSQDIYLWYAFEN